MLATRAQSISLMTSTGPDLAWRDLYRVGGLAAFAATFAYVVALVLDFTVPPAPPAGGAATLEYIAAHRSVYILEQILWQTTWDSAHGRLPRTLRGAQGPEPEPRCHRGVLNISALALSVVYPATGDGAPALVNLSDQCVATGDVARRAAYAAAAEGFIAQNAVPTAVGVLGPVGILIAGMLMLQGVFPRGVAYLSLGTGALGAIS